ncbi:MAG: hypothetical protein U0414_27375 [Polyangiaceae bacterium]
MTSVGKRLAKLEAQVAALLAMVAERDTDHRGQDAEIAQLKVRVADLEQQLGQNSRSRASLRRPIYLGLDPRRSRPVEVAAASPDTSRTPACCSRPRR